ncbi:hypothetical protein Hanom_Chr08g00709401 [Helianthus anomalus]
MKIASSCLKIQVVSMLRLQFRSKLMLVNMSWTYIIYMDHLLLKMKVKRCNYLPNI